MKLGWIGKADINKALAGKDANIYQKQTKSKKYKVYLNDSIGITEEQIRNLLVATGIGQKLTLDDAPALMTFCKSVILTDRGMDND